MCGNVLEVQFLITNYYGRLMMMYDGINTVMVISCNIHMWDMFRGNIFPHMIRLKRNWKSPSCFIPVVVGVLRVFAVTVMLYVQLLYVVSVSVYSLYRLTLWCVIDGEAVMTGVFDDE